MQTGACLPPLEQQLNGRQVRQNNVANKIDAGVRAACVDVFTMISPLLLDKQFGDRLAGQQPRGKLFRVGDNCAGGGCQFPMLSTGKIERKWELSADSNKTAGNVRPGNRAGVPCVEEQEDCLEGYSDRIVLVAHYLQALVEIPIDTLDEHGVVVGT